MAEQILSEIAGTEAALSYKLDGVDFLSFNVWVSKSNGLVDALKMKEPQGRSWDGDHGSFVDLYSPRYESREIELECFIKASNKIDFYNKVTAFIKALQKPQLRRLDVIISNKPLIYMVYLAESVSIRKEWRSSDMIGTFSIKLIEPQPVKRLLKFTAVTGAMTVSMTLTTQNPVNIYWGDGSQLLDVYGDAITKTRVYASAGTYYILIAGVIEEISSFSTTAEVVWTKY